MGTMPNPDASLFLGQVPELPDFIAREYPCKRRMFIIDGGAYSGRHMHFVDHGDSSAQPVLLMHGNPMWSFLWRKVISGLDGFRIIAPDMIGLGLSDKPSKIADHKLGDHGDALASLVRALDLKRLILVGQDWGGPMVTAIGAREPERIAGLVLANTAVVVPQRPRNTAFHRFANRPILSDLAFRVLGFPLSTLHKVQGDPATLKGDVARAYKWPLRRIKDRIAPLALARMVPTSGEHPTMAPMRHAEAWVRSFEGPISLVWGTKDPILGRALKRHEETFPNAPVRRCEAGHFLQEEVPELLVEAINETAERISKA